MFLTSALVWGDCSASRPGRFTPSAHCIGGWMAPRAGLNNVEKRKFWSYRDLNSVAQPVASWYTDCATPAPPCSSGNTHFFGGTYCFHLQDWRVSQARNQEKRTARCAHFTVLPPSWRQYVPPKRLSASEKHGFKTRKMVFLSHHCENHRSNEFRFSFSPLPFASVDVIQYLYLLVAPNVMMLRCLSRKMPRLYE
jgi:hypothetical protein